MAAAEAGSLQIMVKGIRSVADVDTLLAIGRLLGVPDGSLVEAGFGAVAITVSLDDVVVPVLEEDPS